MNLQMKLDEHLNHTIAAIYKAELCASRQMHSILNYIKEFFEKKDMYKDGWTCFDEAYEEYVKWFNSFEKIHAQRKKLESFMPSYQNEVE